MIATHEELRAKARTVNDEPTATDQSAARETDLNIILQRYAQSGTLQSHGKDPMYEDWTEYPEDLRGFIERARTAEKLRASLPQELKGKTLDELVRLTPNELHNILTPPAPTPPPKDEPK